MAVRYVAVSSAGGASETPHAQTTLAATVATAIETAGTANAVAGAKADVTTELAAITTALTALTANQPAGAIVVALDVSAVVTLAKFRRLLDAAYAQIAASNILS